jgi:hypothetical protein
LRDWRLTPGILFFTTGRKDCGSVPFLLSVQAGARRHRLRGMPVLVARLSFFFMDFHDAHDVDVRIFERLLNIGKLRILNFENEIRLGSHEYAS